MNPVERRKVIEFLTAIAVNDQWMETLRVDAAKALATFDLAAAVRDADPSREIAGLTEAVRDAGNVA